MSSVLEQKIAELKQALKAVNSEYAKMKDLPPAERASFGKEINAKKQKIADEIKVLEEEAQAVDVESLDITAPCDCNQDQPQLLTPIMVANIL